MKTLREARKRNRAIILLLLPAIIFFWMVGWGLYWIGHQRESRKVSVYSHKEADHVHFIHVFLEEPIELRSE